MTLSIAIKSYLIYLQAVRLPARQMKRYRRALQDVAQFYGPDKPLSDFDENSVLAYVEQNDPFDKDPLHEERGNVFCMLVHWMMQNSMIPAWSNAWAADQAWDSVEQLERRENRYAG